MSTATYVKVGKVSVNGKKKIVYKKSGSSKQYVVYKKKHIGLLKYKKICAKKMMKRSGGAKKRRVHRIKRHRRYSGGEDNISGALMDASNGISNALLGMSGSTSTSSGSQNVSGSMSSSSGSQNPVKNGGMKHRKGHKKVHRKHRRH
jgi:hypothetical protein